MSVKVSVVIPVWNPGHYLDRGVASLLAQTMPSSDFEALFMDDGSTDGTETRLDELAATYPHFRVHHLENSGWPGKPRNVGIERAVGDYVLFMDNDDALGPEALERMYAIGARNDSDIVIGKVISDFRGVPHQVFRTTRERATVRDAPLFDSLTPHKMFRRQFLLDHDIRYPEGKRRLEDQLIMARAYFPAKNVSIVGDYVCYYYLKRDDGKNAGSTRIEPSGYYQNLREVLDVVEKNTEPGAFRDKIQRRFYRGEMLGRMGPPSLAKYPTDYRDRLVDEVRRLALDPRFAPGVYDGLPALLRVRSYLLREGRIDDLLVAAERYSEVRAHARLDDMRWRDGVLLLDVRTWFTYRNTPLELIRSDGRLYLSPDLAVDVPLEQRECTDQLGDVLADLAIKNRDTAEEFFLPTAAPQRSEITIGPSGEDEVITVEWRYEARIDANTAFGGRPLARGVWDVSVKLAGLGVSRTTRLGNDRAAGADQGRRPGLLSPDRIVIPYWTKPYSNLSVDVDQYVKKLPSALATPVVRLTGSARLPGIEVALALIAADDRDVPAKMRLTGRHSTVVLERPLEMRRSEAGVAFVGDLPRGRGSYGHWDLSVIAPALGWDEPGRSLGMLVRPRFGRPQIRAAQASASSPTRALLPGIVRRARRIARRVVRR